MSKQCTCGRSASYPFCDNTHKQPAGPVIQTINPHAFMYFNKDQAEDKKIVQISKFVSKPFSDRLIEVFEKDSLWQDVGFYKAKNLFHINFEEKDLADNWETLMSTTKRAVEAVFKSKVVMSSVYIQKWPEGSYGVKHNDTYNFDGSIANLRSKIASTLFLHSPFTGGDLEFPDHDVSIQPKLGSLYTFQGGPGNEHQITKITSGLRYTVISFWDFEDANYTEEEIKAMNSSEERWKNYIKTGEGL